MLHCGQSKVTLSPNVVKYWWRVINHACFDGKLTTPTFLIVETFTEDDSEFLGYCEIIEQTSQIVIGILRELPTREVFLTVLTHEMVHQWELENYNNVGHGKRFNSWAMFMQKEIGISLSEFIKV